MSEHAVVPWYTSIIEGTTAVPKSAAKLIDTVGEQIGLFMEPIHIRRKGRAAAGVRVEEAKADAEIEVIEVNNKLAIKDIRARATERDRKKQENRQRNVEKVAQDAYKQMPEVVSDTPVDPDWTTQFFDHCQDVSDAQMQSAWSRILAGEVTKPGSFSLRTLNAVKVLSKADAERFARFCVFVWATPRGPQPYLDAGGGLAGKGSLPFYYSDFIALQECGLIFEGGGWTGFNITFPDGEGWDNWAYYGRRMHLSKQGQDLKLATGKYVLSAVGRELVTIAQVVPDESYRQAAVKHIQSQGFLFEDFDPKRHRV